MLLVIQTWDRFLELLSTWHDIGSMHVDSMGTDVPQYYRYAADVPMPFDTSEALVKLEPNSVSIVKGDTSIRFMQWNYNNANAVCFKYTNVRDDIDSNLRKAWLDKHPDGISEFSTDQPVFICDNVYFRDRNSAFLQPLASRLESLLVDSTKRRLRERVPYGPDRLVAEFAADGTSGASERAADGATRADAGADGGGGDLLPRLRL